LSSPIKNKTLPDHLQQGMFREEFPITYCALRKFSSKR